MIFKKIYFFRALESFVFFAVLCPGFLTQTSYAGAKESKAAYAGKEELDELTPQLEASFAKLEVSQDSAVVLDDHQVKALIKVFDTLPPSERSKALENARARLQNFTDVSIAFSLGDVNSDSKERLKRELNALALVLTWLSYNSKILHLTLTFGNVPATSDTVGIVAVAEAVKLFPRVKSLTFGLTNSGINNEGMPLLIASVEYIYTNRNVISSDLNRLRNLTFELGGENHINNETLFALSDTLEKFPDLEVLSLGLAYRAIGNAAGVKLVKVLGGLRKLIRLELDIQLTAIKSAAALDIVKVVSTLPSLKVFIFYASGCGILSKTKNNTVEIALVKLVKQMVKLQILKFNMSSEFLSSQLHLLDELGTALKTSPSDNFKDFKIEEKQEVICRGSSTNVVSCLYYSLSWER